MSNRYGASACLRACATLALALARIAATNAQTTAAPQTTGASPMVQQQRDAIRVAYAAASDGKDWRPLAQGLKDYPLYPYLEAAALQHDLRTASTAEIDAYLERYAGMIPAGDLRKAELGWLAEQEDWTGFLHFYRPGLGDSLTCDALQARIAQGQPLDFERDLSALWQQSSLPSACAPVLKAAFLQGLLTPKRIWDRIERAADAGRSATITQSAAWLTGTGALSAKRIAEAIASPKALLKKATSFADTPRDREAVARAVIRFAHSDSAQAITDWQSLSQGFTFNQDQRNRVLAALALYNAVDLGPDALPRLAALPAAAQTDATREWRVRVAVALGDWKIAKTALAALGPEELQHGEWRYWQARVDQELGDDAAARDGYAALAEQATFYGFLAADRAGLPYSICPETVPVDPVLDQQIEANPGFARAFELFAV